MESKKMKITTELKEMIREKIKNVNHDHSKQIIHDITKKEQASIDKLKELDKQKKDLLNKMVNKYKQYRFDQYDYTFRYADNHKYNYYEIIAKLQYKNDKEAQEVFKLIEKGEFDKL